MLTKLRKMFYRARGYYNGRLNGDPFRLDPYHSKFWRKATAGDWEPETFAVLDKFLSPDRDYIDIGAWAGATVLYAARRARHVWCFEPDPVAYRYLIWNLELNGITNVSAFGAALWGETGVMRMASLGGEPGDSMTSVLGDTSKGTEALSLSWEVFEKAVDLSDVSLVKMDVEGAEFALVPHLRPWLQQQRPAFYLSTHAPFVEQDGGAVALQELAKNLEFYGGCSLDGVEQPVQQAFSSDRARTQFPSFLFT
ncbi:FkbM family methyltransferase [Ruegeria sp. HKCCD7255]|uniref:FkbM family methyltransferase n=1 Tax=Ruegeria sp. HKCCD7255 TaxID=2683004 RepID=UPI0014882A01|nr:FkbM family methyltransferase [Ruegeria sp. HKCCD7255]